MTVQAVKVNTLILGIGNTLLSDEGAGIHALQYLRNRYPQIPGVRYLDGGTLGFTLAGEIEDSENLIVIDAARLGASPGTVRCLTGAAMDHFLGRGRQSVHEVGLVDLMDIARLTSTFPKRRALIGIQPGTLGWGDEPSAPVSRAFPEVAQQARQLIEQWSVQDN
jgi:hydrogenase maturation protease